MQKSNNKDQKIGQILGINVLSTDTSRVLTAVKQKVSSSIKFSILTPNPELVLMAQSNKELKDALNSAHFPIPDGIGLAQAFKFLSLSAPKNIVLRTVIVFFQGIQVGAATFFNRKWLTDKLNVLKGREVFNELIKLSNENKWRVFLLGGEGNEAKMAARKLENSFGNLKIESSKGPKLNDQAEPVSQVDIKMLSDTIKQINHFTPHLLFVAFGNPKQEIWIHKNLSNLNVGGAMAVGGTFRYLSGFSKLPPKWMEYLGLEWLWRLIVEPYRIKRIWNAVIAFPLKVFLYKLNRG